MYQRSQGANYLNLEDREDNHPTLGNELKKNPDKNEESLSGLTRQALTEEATRLINEGFFQVGWNLGPMAPGQFAIKHEKDGHNSSEDSYAIKWRDQADVSSLLA